MRIKISPAMWSQSFPRRSARGIWVGRMGPTLRLRFLSKTSALLTVPCLPSRIDSCTSRACFLCRKRAFLPGFGFLDSVEVWSPRCLSSLSRNLSTASSSPSWGPMQAEDPSKRPGWLPLNEISLRTLKPLRMCPQSSERSGFPVTVLPDDLFGLEGASTGPTDAVPYLGWHLIPEISLQAFSPPLHLPGQSSECLGFPQASPQSCRV